MKQADNERLILGAGIVVLAISLAVPAFQKIAEMHGVRDVAARMAEVPRRLVASGTPGKTLSLQVKGLVDGLSPDVALADAKIRAGDVAEAKATPVSPKKDKRPVDSNQKNGDIRVVVDWSATGNAKLRVATDDERPEWSYPVN